MKLNTQKHSDTIQLCIRTALCDCVWYTPAFETPLSQKLCTKRPVQFVCRAKCRGPPRPSLRGFVCAPPGPPVGVWYGDMLRASACALV